MSRRIDATVPTCPACRAALPAYPAANTALITCGICGVVARVTRVIHETFHCKEQSEQQTIQRTGAMPEGSVSRLPILQSAEERAELHRVREWPRVGEVADPRD